MRKLGEYVIKAFRYRLYPTRAQEATLRETFERLRELYNAALQERRSAYRTTGKSPSCYSQQKSLAEVRELRPEYSKIHTHLLQDALTRLERAFQRFFDRCKRGEKPGYPRFKSVGRYRTFTFKDIANRNGAALVSGNKRLRLTGIGNVKIKLHRPYEGRIKQISVTLDGGGRWHASLICDCVAIKTMPISGQNAGLDVGISTFAMLSDGYRVENPRLLERAQAGVAKAQRRISRRKRGSARRRKAVVLAARRHAYVSRARKDFHHKTVIDLVRRYDWIAIEDLDVIGLANGMLAKQVRDVGWAQFAVLLAAKAVSAGREVIRVDPRGTSQVCSECGCEVLKALAVRVHDCPHCGYVADRDLNAARNIHRLGQSLRGG